MSPGYTVALLGVVAILVLVLLNAFFVATEFSLVAVRRSQIKIWERERRRGAAATGRRIVRLDDSIAATQLGITLASIGLGWLGEPALAGFIGPCMARLGFESLRVRAYRGADRRILGRHVPTRRGRRARAEGDRARPARPRRSHLLGAASPLREAHASGALGDERLRQRARAPDRHPAGGRGGETAHTSEELALLVTESDEAGELRPATGRMLGGVLSLTRKRVRDVMVPRERVFAIERRTDAGPPARPAPRGGLHAAPRLCRRARPRRRHPAHEGPVPPLREERGWWCWKTRSAGARAAARSRRDREALARLPPESERTWRWCATRAARARDRDARGRARADRRPDRGRARRAPASGRRVRRRVASADARRGSRPGRWRVVRAAGCVGPGWGCSPPAPRSAVARASDGRGAVGASAFKYAPPCRGSTASFVGSVGAPGRSGR